MVVLCTAADEAGAQDLARKLVEEGLAACVSCTAVHSTYRWDDAVVGQGEVLLVIKTEARLWTSLQRRIRELHTYECPEIVGIEASQASPDYLAWVLGACRGAT